MRVTKKHISRMFSDLGKKGAVVRNARLSPEEKRAIAQHAARTRWINMQKAAQAEGARV